MRSGVRLRLTGGMPERFIRKVLEAGLRVEGCCREGARSTVVCVPRRDVSALRQLAEKYGVGCEVIGESGWSALAGRLLRRRSALLGAVTLLCTGALLLSRIWMVEVRPVDDTEAAVVQKIAQVLAENGAVPGAAARSLDRAQLRAKLISEVPEAGYVSVRRRGVCLVAEVSQVIVPPATYDIGAARDIVAMYDGVVQRVDVYAGTAAVKPGATVRRGDVLIFGQERTSGEVPAAVSAEGVVMARIWQEAEASQSMEAVELVPTGRVRVSEKLRVPGWEFPLTGGEPYKEERIRQEFLPLGGLFVPAGIVRTTHEECTPQRVKRDPEAVKRLLLEEAEAILDENMPFGARVIDKWEDYSMIDSGVIYMKLTRELEADIAAAGRPEN